MSGDLGDLVVGSDDAARFEAPVANTPATPTPTPSTDREPSFDFDWSTDGQSNSEPSTSMSSSDQALSDNKQPSDSESETPSGFPVLKIKGDKGEHEFTLDPNDEKLKKDLSLVVGAKRAFSELAAVRKEKKALDEQVSTMTASHEVMQTIGSHLDNGDYERVAKAVLGDKYGEFIQSQIESYLSYESASPAERAELDAKRAQDAENAKFSAERDAVRKERETLEAERRAERKNLYRNMALAQYQQYDMAKYFPDAQHAERKNRTMWREALSELADLDTQGVEITPSVVKREFRAAAKSLLYGVKQLADAKVKQITDQKSKETTQNMQISSERQEQKQRAAGTIAHEWNGKSAKDLLRMMRAK